MLGSVNDLRFEFAFKAATQTWTRLLTTHPDLRAAACPWPGNSKHQDYRFSVIREIEIWRVAVPMVKRYADDLKANSF
jgi:hypothetical protein